MRDSGPFRTVPHSTGRNIASEPRPIPDLCTPPRTTPKIDRPKFDLRCILMTATMRAIALFACCVAAALALSALWGARRGPRAEEHAAEEHAPDVDLREFMSFLLRTYVPAMAATYSLTTSLAPGLVPCPVTIHAVSTLYVHYKTNVRDVSLDPLLAAEVVFSAYLRIPPLYATPPETWPQFQFIPAVSTRIPIYDALPYRYIADVVPEWQRARMIAVVRSLDLTRTHLWFIPDYAERAYQW